MTALAFSDELARWATGAGMKYRAIESSGVAYFADDGGEYVYYVRASSDDTGWFVVTRSSRGDEEQFMFSACGIDIIEKYFWSNFGFDIRAVKRLPRLKFPGEAADAADGYSVRPADDGQTMLLDANDEPVVRTDGDDVTDIFLLVEISYCLKWSNAELEQAFSDPDGHPIFPIQVAGRSSE